LEYRNCRIQHQDIKFRDRKVQLIDNQDKGHQEIGKKPDLTNPKDFPEYL